MYAVCYNNLKTIEVAQGMVQDIFLSLWERRETLIITISVEHYLVRSAKMNVFEYIRNKTGHTNHLAIIQAEATTALLLPPSESPDQHKALMWQGIANKLSAKPEAPVVHLHHLSSRRLPFGTFTRMAAARGFGKKRKKDRKRIQQVGLRKRRLT